MSSGYDDVVRQVVLVTVNDVLGVHFRGGSGHQGFEDLALATVASPVEEKTWNIIEYFMVIA